MVLIRSGLAALILLLVSLTAFAPASAHDKSKHVQTQATKPPPVGMTPGAVHERMQEHAEAMEEAKPKTFAQRVVSWLGRTHPFAVHFPIALFPVSLVALVLARKRGESVEVIRALIIVAGVGGVIAATLGWLTAGFVMIDQDAVQLWHRWIGTGLGAIGGGLAIWAWRRRDAVSSGAMVAALSMITLALLVQGWLGAALVHGMNHMAF